MKSLAHIYSRVFDVPLAIQTSKFDAIIAAIGNRLVGLNVDDIEAAAKANANKKDASKTYAVQDGIAIVPVFDSLMKKTSGLNAVSGCSSYELISAQLQECVSDPNVKGVIFDIDSPGGETHGLFELCDIINGLKAQSDKPVYAVANDAAYSAAYAIASCADKLYVTRTGGVGSIGVFCAHVDQSVADENEGLKYTFIHAGDKKTDGNPHEPLSDSAREDTQAEVDRQYQMFVSLVAKNRGIDLQAVKDTEAGCLFGQNAVPLLADKVGTLQDAFMDMVSSVNTQAQIMPAIQPHAKYSSAENKAEEITEEQIMAKKKSAEIEINELLAMITAKKKQEADDVEEADKKADDYLEKMDDGDDDMDDDEDEEDEPKKKNDAAKRAIKISALCELAGRTDLTTKFLASGASYAKVQAALWTLKSEKSNAVKVDSAAPDASGASPALSFRNENERIMTDPNVKDKAKAFQNFLNKNAAAYAKYQHSERGIKGVIVPGQQV